MTLFGKQRLSFFVSIAKRNFTFIFLILKCTQYEAQEPLMVEWLNKVCYMNVRGGRRKWRL